MSVNWVRVERDGGELVARWDADGPVTVTVGPSADEPGPHEIRPDTPGSVRLTGLDPTVRHYVRVQAGGQAVVAAERLVPLQGTMNFRDLGGYVGVGGRRVRWGRVYRSDGLAELTALDGEYLTGLGIKLVCDFRNDREVDVAPSALPLHMERRWLPVGGDPADQPLFLERILAGEVTSFGLDAMAATYAELLDTGAAQFGAVIAHAADPSCHPLLFHCTAGKDRTGITSALLLGALGVSDDDVCSDYELTTFYRSGRRLEQLRPQLEAAGVDVDAVLPFLTAQRPVMEATLETVRERWGSIDGYLTGPAGLAPEVVERVRTVLLA